MIPLISISNGKPAMAAPLAFVVSVSMIKDAFEDYKRHQSDKKENNTECQVIDRHTGRFAPMMWKNIHCGDIVRVDQDHFIPCDLVLLSSSDEKGVAFVETKNLDGETNLKQKQA